jgi:hypothetical protein
LLFYGVYVARKGAIFHIILKMERILFVIICQLNYSELRAAHGVLESFVSSRQHLTRDMLHKYVEVNAELLFSNVVSLRINQVATLRAVVQRCGTC